MGKSSSVTEFAAKMDKAAHALERAQTAAVTAVARTTKTVFLAAPGAPHKVAGKSVGVGYTVSGKSALVAWRGPVHLVNNPTQAHDIEPKKKKALLMADGNVRARGRHPGTRGKRFYEKGRATAEQLGPEIYRREMLRTLSGVFG